MAVPARRERAPLLRPRTDDRNLLAGKYIVKFKDGKGGDKMSVSALNNKISTLNVSPDHVYKTTFQGFSGQLTDEELEALRHSNDVRIHYPRMSRTQLLTYSARSSMLSRTLHFRRMHMSSRLRRRGDWVVYLLATARLESHIPMIPAQELGHVLMLLTQELMLPIP
jgi:hypothetical protein